MSTNVTRVDVRPREGAALEKTAKQAADRTRSRRSQFLKWLRKIHGWVGLWGAVIGLLFGVTGLLQNHRSTMKIKIAGPIVSTVHIALPNPPPKNPKALGEFLHEELKLDRPPLRTLREASRPVTWGDQSVVQPERWGVRFVAPGYLIDAEYWKGSTFVDVERRDQGLISTLEGLHRSQGAGVGWILFADSIAGAMILLSLTGVILWTELNRRRTIGATIFVVSLVASILLALQSV